MVPFHEVSVSIRKHILSDDSFINTFRKKKTNPNPQKKKCWGFCAVRVWLLIHFATPRQIRTKQQAYKCIARKIYCFRKLFGGTICYVLLLTIPQFTVRNIWIVIDRVNNIYCSFKPAEEICLSVASAWVRYRDITGWFTYTGCFSKRC